MSNIPSGTNKQLRQQALAQLQAGKVTEARKLLQQATEVDARDADAWILLAQINHNQQGSDALETCLHQRCSLQPHNPMPHYNLGILMQQKGRPADALVHFQAAAAADASSALPLAGMATCQCALGKHLEAEHLCRSALAIDPNQAEAWNSLGLCLRATQQIEASIDAFQKAIRLRPDCPDFHVTLGISLGISDLTTQAMQAFDESCDLRKEHGQFIQGMIYVAQKPLQVVQ